MPSRRKVAKVLQETLASIVAQWYVLKNMLKRSKKRVDEDGGGRVE